MSSGIIEQGQIIGLMGDDRKRIDFLIRPITLKNYDAAVELQNIAVNMMGKKYHPVPESMIVDCLDHGKSLGLFVEDRIVGMRLAYDHTKSRQIASTSAEIAESLKIPEDEMQACVYFCGVMLLPEYRGNKLGLRMTNHALSLLDINKHYHIYTTVHPENYPSLSNLLNIGLLIKSCGISYGADLRFILHRDLRRGSTYIPRQSKVVRSDDIERNKQVISQGYVGFMPIKNSGGFFICYGQ